ncbi:MAG: SprT family zinc-dependent metalloprotease [Vicinamibacterales bacterium]
MVPLRSGAGTMALRLVRHRRARRYVLRVTDAADVVVTMPRWGSIAEARAFAEQHLTWIARERLRRATESTSHAWAAGSAIWLRGERCPIAIEGGVVTAGSISARPGGASDLKALLRGAMREQAARELPQRLTELAERAGLRVARITVRDQRSRWGSCSTRGAITLNWRLLQMPPSVRDYVLWHELMHLRRADHSAAFWKLVEQVCPDYRAAKAWLLKHGKELA